MPSADANRFHLLVHYLKMYWLFYLFGIVAILCTNWIAVNIPRYVQKSIDLLDQNLDMMQDLLLQYLWIMIGLALLMMMVRILSRILFFNPGRAIESRIKNDMFHQLMGLQKDYYDENPTGNIISRINNDINGVRMICGFGMMQIFNILAALSMTPYKMWQLSPRLTLYCVLPLAGVFIVVRLGMRVLVRNMRARMENLQNLSGFTVSSLSGIDVVKSYAMQSWNQGKFEEVNREMVKRGLKIAWIRSFIMPLLMNLENILKLLILLVGGMMVIRESLSIGEMTAFITYAAMLTIPLMGLGWMTTMFQQGLIGLASIQTILQQTLPRRRIKNLEGNRAQNLFNWGLRIENLSYRYPGTTSLVLKNITVTIMPGQIVGLLGRIGSGKTSFVNCLNRYLEIENGRIFLGEKDINLLPDRQLRKIVRTVTQEPFLFSDSVEANIRFGRTSEISLGTDQIQEIIKKSALWDEVERFPQKVKTMVGEKGILLSGGQKQRISLARAVAEPCDLLILDNVLSAVDYDTERFLLKEIHQLLKPQNGEPPLAGSILIVSHRVTGMEKANRILVLEDGIIADQGSHVELIQRPGYYQEMFRLQNEDPDEHADRPGNSIPPRTVPVLQT